LGKSQKSQRSISDRSTIYDEGAENAPCENDGPENAGMKITGTTSRRPSSCNTSQIAIATHVLCIMYTLSINYRK